MIIRKYETNDCAAMAQLFYDTVHTVNAKDYTKEQLNVWATGNVDLAAWNASFLAHHTVIAVDETAENRIIGFGDMAEDGYLDRLYVHRDYQHQGVATAICDVLESYIQARCIDMATQTASDQTFITQTLNSDTSALNTPDTQSLSPAAIPIFTTHASITARPFFEKRGYVVLKEQQVERFGVLLTNYVMEKRP